MENASIIRKETIISAAIDLIDECGIQGLSTKEIAKRQEVSEATIFKHFKTKNGLISAVLDQFSLFDNEIGLTIKMKKMKPVNAIKFLYSAHLDYYESYPALTSVAEAYDAVAYDPELSEKVKSIYSNQVSLLCSLIKQAQDEGEIIKEADSSKVADVFIGIFRSICIKWRFENKGFSLKDETMKTLNMVLEAFQK